MLVVLVVLIVLGLCAGSFVNALVWRVHKQEQVKKKEDRKKKRANNFIPYSQFSILSGRSMCPNCAHELAAKDLIPILSWLSLQGRCRYCSKPISFQYPLIEFCTALLFVLSYLFWQVGNGQWLLLATWLAASVGLMALLVYDFQWMILPNRIIYPTFFVALTGRLAYIILYAPDKASSFKLLALSLLVASGIFFVLFYISDGKWIGYGDVRLGLITGTLLAIPSLSLLMIFTASVMGTIAALPGLAAGKKTVLSKLPFGPFLIAATGIVILFGQNLIDWYTNLL